MIEMLKPENMVFGTGEIEHGNGFSLAGLKRVSSKLDLYEKRGDWWTLLVGDDFSNW